MSERYRTVASFDLAYKADIVKSALEEAGIAAVVTDREIVSMEWLLANAVGGVKVQVAEADEGRAAAVIDALYREGFDGMKVSDEELERQALATAAADDEPEPPDLLPQEATAADSPDAPPPVDRDQYAKRFMLCSVFSLIFPPLVFYAFYLGLVAVFGSGRMSGIGWQRVGFGVAFGGLLLAAVLWLFTVMY